MSLSFALKLHGKAKEIGDICMHAKWGGGGGGVYIINKINNFIYTAKIDQLN